MRPSFFIQMLIAATLIIGCKKEIESKEEKSPSEIDKMTSLCSKWKLNLYTIEGDLADYYYTGTGISTHALRTLLFARDGNYTSGNTAWSGTFNFSDDSTQIILTPSDSHLFPITLSINIFTSSQIELSTPQVNVNPEDQNSSNYEKFVVFQGFSWLYHRNIDVSEFRTIKIRFKYYQDQVGY